MTHELKGCFMNHVITPILFANLAEKKRIRFDYYFIMLVVITHCWSVLFFGSVTWVDAASYIDISRAIELSASMREMYSGSLL